MSEPTLGELDRKIDALTTHMDKGFSDIRKEIGDQRSAMFGNGSPGFSGQLISLAAKVDVLERCARMLDDRSFRWRIAQWGWVIAIVTAILSLLRSFL